MSGRLPDHVLRLDPDPSAPGRYAASCKCGGHTLDLESKRAGRRWHERHLTGLPGSAGTVDLTTPNGRGHAAQLAYKRAVLRLVALHPDTFAELERAERRTIGLDSLGRPIRQERTP